jgi:cytochrome c-type biogenesis protein CcmH/NrfG
LNDTFLNVEGTSRFQLGNFKDAISTFEKGYQLAPSNAELQMNLANALGAADTCPKAAQLLEVIYNQDPSNTNALCLLKITLK